MSQKRHGFKPWWGDGPRPVGPKGERLCSMCPNPVKKPRREYCSDECVDKRLIQTSGDYARRKVFERDHGVCAGCSFDTEAFRVRYIEANRQDEKERPSVCLRCRFTTIQSHVFRCPDCDGIMQPDRDYTAHREPLLDELVRRNYAAAFVSRFRSSRGWCEVLWQADHIVPVVEGGGQCDLTNFRTLCLPCHASETAALAARRARQKKLAQKYPLFDPSMRRS